MSHHSAVHTAVTTDDKTNLNTNEYMHGHTDNVLNVHKQRTVANSMAFIVPYLAPDSQVLDLGCGPGSITIDVALNYAVRGHVIGIEPTEDPLKVARQTAREKDIAGFNNVEFRIGSGYKLEFPDNTFDLVYAHQVVQYLPDAPLIFAEMLRVTKPGGYVAFKEGDTHEYMVYPPSVSMRKFFDIWNKLVALNGGHELGCSAMHAEAVKAGYDYQNMTLSSSCWCIYKEEAASWGASNADRLLNSKFGDSLVKNEICTEQEIKELAAGLREWGTSENAMFIMPHLEMIYTKPK